MEVIVAPRSAKRADEIAEKVSEKVRRKAKGAKVAFPEEATAVVEDREAIILKGAAGVEILPEGSLPKSEKCMVAADVNAFPPAG